MAAAAVRAARGPDCALCRDDGGVLVARTPLLRAVLVEDPDHPAFVRVIWNAHVAEMSDLGGPERAHLMEAVHGVETALREVMTPDKINLASLGNQVPHLHWHIIARFADDAHFPQPIWGARQRDPGAERLLQRRARLPELAASIAARLAL
jgi:diadenosine tetraphosphate (Ap4A) HIT family hydrolase